MDGDPAAFLKLSRLVSNLLSRWRAFDFRDDWEDLIQEVLLAVVESHRENRIQERAAVFGYIRTIAHNKFQDRLRLHVRYKEDSRLAWEEVADKMGEKASPSDSSELSLEVRNLLSKLPEGQADILISVYARGCTYEQVAKDTGTPLGTLKRQLRAGLAALRQALEDDSNV